MDFNQLPYLGGEVWDIMFLFGGVAISSVSLLYWWDMSLLET